MPSLSSILAVHASNVGAILRVCVKLLHTCHADATYSQTCSYVVLWVCFGSVCGPRRSGHEAGPTIHADEHDPSTRGGQERRWGETSLRAQLLKTTMPKLESQRIHVLGPKGSLGFVAPDLPLPGPLGPGLVHSSRWRTDRSEWARQVQVLTEPGKIQDQKGGPGPRVVKGTI